MKNRFIVNPRAMIFYLVISILFFIMLITMAIIERPGSALVFGVLSAIYFFVAVYYSAILTVDDSGITKTIFGRKIYKLEWDKFKEIGVCGVKVFNLGNTKKTGTLYIYFSDTSLMDSDRFQMILEWPPRKNRFFMLYTGERIRNIQAYWDKDIKKYNTGDLIMGEDL